MTQSANRRSPFVTVILTSWFLGLLALAAFSQSTAQRTSQVEVIVTDRAGAVIPDAEITFKGHETVSGTTARDGTFHLSLPFDQYAVTVSRSGFKTRQIVSFPVETATRYMLPIVLDLGGIYDPVGLNLDRVLISSELPNPPAVANSQYFPTGVFEKSYHSFRDKWYSNTLRSLQEPSLFALRSDTALEIYRFIWIPSFHQPISVRLTINSGGSSLIVARSVDDHAGLLTRPASDTGKLILDTRVPIDNAETQEVLTQLQRLGFWVMSTDEEQVRTSGGHTLRVVGTDGSRWILEGVRGGEYHVVDRWSPKDNSFSQFCKYLLRLAKVEASLY